MFCVKLRISGTKWLPESDSWKQLPDSTSVIGRLTPEIINARRRARGNPPAPTAAAVVADLHKAVHENKLLPLRNKLRKMWTERDLTAKRFAILNIAELHYSRAPSKDGVGRLLTPTPMSQVLEYLLRSNVHTSICTNPQCPNPYFFQRRSGEILRRKVCGFNTARVEATLVGRTRGRLAEGTEATADSQEAMTVE